MLGVIPAQPLGFICPLIPRLRKGNNNVWSSEEARAGKNLLKHSVNLFKTTLQSARHTLASGSSFEDKGL